MIRTVQLPSLLPPVLLTLVLLLPACTLRPPAPPVEPPAPTEPAAPLQAVDWAELPGWHWENPARALEAFQRSCRALRFRSDWQASCQAALQLAPDIEAAELRVFFEQTFTPHRVQNPDGSTSGLITGYYVPDLAGRRAPTGEFSYPLYGVPDDLLVIDLAAVYPELGNYRLRGRLDGRRVVPYWDRAAIDGHTTPLEGQELLWVEDPVELFFLHIQGSGRITLKDGETILVNYAEQNGHPYRSIGKLLLERGEMTRDQMSMQNIRAWAQANPDQVTALLGENPSYIFFRELPHEDPGPPGAMGIPLTPERSLAVDPRTIPLGAPVFVATTWPSTELPLRRLMVAQDTGGAIKGAVRADFFWGMGDAAGDQAGRMKQDGRLWVLLPRPTPPSAPGPENISRR